MMLTEKAVIHTYLLEGNMRRCLPLLEIWMINVSAWGTKCNP